MITPKRKYDLRIWALGFGFFFFYTPYSGLTKALSSGLLGVGGPVRGIVLLPISAIATVVGMYSFITAMQWWKYAGRRQVFGVTVPFPRRLTFLSGVCMATIMGTTTLAFTFGGLSIVLVLVLLRGGTLIIAPMVDAIVGRRVRWFSWAAMVVSLLAVLVVLIDAGNYRLSSTAAVVIIAYLTAYFFKLQFMSRLAKSDERQATLSYFVEEQMVASPLLVLTLAVLAFIGAGDVMMGFRAGFTSFLSNPDAIFAVLVGLFYAALCVCTTFIFLDRRENTFCMPMHCGSSMLSGFTATYALALLLNQNIPSVPQITSAGLIIVALGFLSPLHHFQRTADSLQAALANAYGRLQDWLRGQPKARAPVKPTPQIILFVCSGNTCRSPMAAAICNAEIAARLGIPFEALETVNVRAMSAGISAKVGAPLTPEARQVLQSLSVPVGPHAASNLTVELADQADLIFCMTSAHRRAVLDMIPSAAAKTLCLDPNRDVEDPIGSGTAAYLSCARRIRDLVRVRFDEIGLRSGLHGEASSAEHGYV
jgi:protein-tyrosine-phosphatase